MGQYCVLVIVSQVRFLSVSASKLKDFYAMWEIVSQVVDSGQLIANYKFVESPNIRYRKLLSSAWT